MASNNIILVDLIGDVVDSMRAIGEITGSAEVSPGVYTIDSANELKNKEVVSINSVDYVVRDVGSTSFSINADTGLDFTGSSWKALAPYYEHGHPVEIVHTLNKRNTDIYSHKKYPLIALLQDFDSDVDVDDDALFDESNPDIAIVNFTEKNIKAAERYDLNYRTILYPLYFKFIEACISNGYIQTKGKKGFNHTRSEALYYGTRSENGNTANKMDDPLDAITLTNTNFKILDLRC